MLFEARLTRDRAVAVVTVVAGWNIFDEIS